MACQPSRVSTTAGSSTIPSVSLSFLRMHSAFGMVKPLMQLSMMIRNLKIGSLDSDVTLIAFRERAR